MNREKILMALVQSICESDEDENTVESPPVAQIITGEDEVVLTLLPILNVCKKREQTRIKNFVEEVVSSYNEREFIMHFRLRKTMVNSLVDKFQSSDEYQKLNGHGGFQPLSAQRYILIFLWFVGHEAASYRDVADRFGITLAGLYNILTRVADFILTMKSDVIRLPNNIEKDRTKQHYLEQKGFPGIIGSIDGSHIRIDKPLQDKDSYINRKQYFSIHMQGIANEKRKFIDVWIGYPGSVHDARVFRESAIYNILPQLCSDLDDLAILEPPNQDEDVDDEPVIGTSSHLREENHNMQGRDVRDELCRQFAAQI
ncbi:hypothetical protein MML48_1g11491 [Holotrichia oblita]|uniref:Uncharacterized protein n=3 Tax=Holotrichia oblita TaxID=644536 RepID=A0ACB9SG43_HOLOL|nr:hypothetical protein MML48_10g00000191 [Holotrichia oblita]KAI4455609.1 hypothetical protein MML48_9g00005396 [Holotrichia oblita]KAI4469738.1 hypothetical protein MML48_1g11491 [Holotrichia oblita]